MFSKSNKRISLNPLDKTSYDGDTTPIMTDYAPPTPSAPTRAATAHHGSSSSGGGRTLRSAPIHLPTPMDDGRGQRSPQQSQFRQHGQGGGPRPPNGGARRHNTFSSSGHHHGQGSRHRQPPIEQQPQSHPMMYNHASRSQHDLYNPPKSPNTLGYQTTPQMYSPTSPSFQQYPPSPGSPLPPYVERPPPAMMQPPQYSNSSWQAGSKSGGGGRMGPSRSTSDPEIELYENSSYYTNRNRAQQARNERQREQARQRQQQEEKNECCGCFKELAEFCPCCCFCCMLGAAGAA
ncbi:hypothetical protein BGW38_002950 [Lunasporangiospora selenospora]|uniref:Uncharacterized protein n=1 Tax=Lunasporangiospora selenospora TaxID=979761 RepID=A0A9P6KHM6_9FUNG|nr:hypothetical protein BGW38_002950 [Lunasporangiospora selenospora]